MPESEFTSSVPGASHDTSRRVASKRPKGSQPALPAPCAHCDRMAPLCVCHLLRPAQTRHRVLVLQHPQEQDRTLGSAPLLTRGLAHCDVNVGLSWRNLADALQEEQAPLRPWAVLYPASIPKAGRAMALKGADDGSRSHGAYLMNARGRVLPAWPALGGIIVLDGTWSQAKALWWRNPWLLKLPRLGFMAPPQSIYGRVRKEPKPGYMSTLEATAAALDALREDSAIGTNLRRVFRTLVQRLRDDHAQRALLEGKPSARRRGRPQASRSKPSAEASASPSVDAQTPSSDGAMAPSINVDTQTI